MKKLFGLLAFVILLTGCDDGDMTVQSFNFDNATIQKCSTKELLFKTNGNELLLLNIPASNFINEATPAGEPRVVNITASNQVIYRSYNGDVGESTICSEIPPANPSVTEEYNVQPGGTIEIVTTVTPLVNETTNSTSITYSHQIKFKNVQFSNGTNVIAFTEYLFGSYQTLVNTLSFDFSTATTQTCTANTIFKNTANKALVLDLSSALYPSQVGTQTLPLDATNRVIYRQYSGGTIDGSVICAGATPPAPFLITEEWIADEGTATITTTEVLDPISSAVIGYKHSISFANIKYKKGTLSFTHTAFSFGDYITN